MTIYNSFLSGSGETNQMHMNYIVLCYMLPVSLSCGLCSQQRVGYKYTSIVA